MSHTNLINFFFQFKYFLYQNFCISNVILKAHYGWLKGYTPTSKLKFFFCSTFQSCMPWVLSILSISFLSLSLYFLDCFQCYLEKDSASSNFSGFDGSFLMIDMTSNFLRLKMISCQEFLLSLNLPLMEIREHLS